MTEQAAIEEIMERCDGRQEPLVSEALVQTFLARHVRVRLFAASTPLGRGQLVLPATASLDAVGAAYVVVVAGITGSEPSWPTAPGTTASSGPVQLAWWGVYNGVRWDLNEAVREALRTKIALCASLVDERDDTIARALSQKVKGYQAALAALGPSTRGFWG